MLTKKKSKQNSLNESAGEANILKKVSRKKSVKKHNHKRSTRLNNTDLECLLAETKHSLKSEGIVMNSLKKTFLQNTFSLNTKIQIINHRKTADYFKNTFFSHVTFKKNVFKRSGLHGLFSLRTSKVLKEHGDEKCEEFLLTVQTQTVDVDTEPLIQANLKRQRPTILDSFWRLAQFMRILDFNFFIFI